MIKGPLFRWTWSPPRPWRDALTRLAPPKDRASHLLLHWLPAYSGEPAQRWVIFEAVPLAFVPAIHLGALWDARVSDDPTIQWARQMELKTGHVPFPFWVVQGNAMGHPWAYNVVERILSQGGALPSRPPLVGSLKYTEPTELTWAAIAHRRYESPKTLDELQAQLQAAEKTTRKDMMETAEAQVTDLAMAAKQDILDTARPVEQDRINPDWDQEYVDTGKLN